MHADGGKGGKGVTAHTQLDTDKMVDNNGNLVALNPRKRIDFKLIEKEVNTLPTSADKTCRVTDIDLLALVALVRFVVILSAHENAPSSVLSHGSSFDSGAASPEQLRQSCLSLPCLKLKGCAPALRPEAAGRRMRC